LYRPGRTLHLAAAIDGREQYAAAYYVELARLAERGALDFVTLGSGWGAGNHGEGAALDALAVLARVAPATDRIGVVPAVTAAGGDPFGLALAVATLDWVSQGRAGWTLAVPGEREGGGAGRVDVGSGAREPDSGAGVGFGRSAGSGVGSGGDGAAGPGAARSARRRATERRLVERRSAERAEARWLAAEGVAEAVARSWAGGPAPQGRPVVAVDATEAAARGAAARHADLAFVRAAHPESAAVIRGELRRRAAEAGRDPERLLVLADLHIDLGGGELGPEPGAEVVLVTDGAGAVRFNGGPVDLAELIAEWQRSGAVDGFHVRPVEPRRDLGAVRQRDGRTASAPRPVPLLPPGGDAPGTPGPEPSRGPFRRRRRAVLMSGGSGSQSAGRPGSAVAGGRAVVRPMHLAVELPGTGWAGGGAPRPDFDAYVRLARTAERGLFDFLLVAGGGIEPITVLNALAAVTDRIGLAVAAASECREPYELARRIAALDQLSAGRAGGPALVVPEFTVPRSPQGRSVVIQDADDEAAEVVILGRARGSARSGVKVLQRIGWVPDETDSGPAERTMAPVELEAGAEVFTGPVGPLAARLDGLVQSGAVDGFVLVPGPGGLGLDSFVDRVVPLLQERGSLRTAYRGTTLRDHLGLPRPLWKA
jgi:alkanesulfonate monooxygenase SsuD/methylene tetrahydromethanopterin reductase-like flavin-dependent oxidoreductase (luciferase family)